MKLRIYHLLKIIIGKIYNLYNGSFFRYYRFYLDKLYTLGILYNLSSNNHHIYIERLSSFIGLKYISIGKNSYIHKNCRIEAIDLYYNQTFTPEIIIGENVEIGEYNHITAVNRIKIGNGVLTGRRVTISDNNHGLFDSRSLDIIPARRNITCKGEVIIGENVCILSGVSVGKGCVIAANAVVTKDIPNYSLVAGIPARIIKQLN